MVKFNMDMHVGVEAKPPFYKIRMQWGAEALFIVVKKVDIARSAVNGLLTVTGFWATKDEESYNLENRSVCEIIIPVNNIDYIESLMYKSR
jgi:hypothetical protein